MPTSSDVAVHAGSAPDPAWSLRRLLGRAIVGACLVLSLAAADPGGAASATAIAAIHAYRATLGRTLPLLGLHCRFHPTCSHYAEVAVARYGVARGAWLTLGRVLRCGPWTPAGTFDPVQPPAQQSDVPGRDGEAPHPP